MGRYIVLLDWKNQYFKNDHTTQGNVQIQCNSYQIMNGISPKTRTNNFNICMQTQKTLNSQNNLEKEEQSWRNQAPWLLSVPQTYRLVQFVPSTVWWSEVAQLCPTLCDLMDCSLPGSSLHGILQARVLEWVAFSSPGDLPELGIEPGSPAFQADALTSGPPGKPLYSAAWYWHKNRHRNLLIVGRCLRN